MSLVVNLLEKWTWVLQGLWLYTVLEARTQGLRVGVSAALFDQPLPEKICKHTLVADKGNYYTIADGLPQHEGY